MAKRTPFDEKYWNLAQAAAWVEFRERDLVEQFAIADRESYKALHMYPSMWPETRKRLNSIDELHHALEEGRLTASGYHVGEPDRLAQVPAAEWMDLVISPPIAYVAGELSTQKQRWSDVRVLSADIKRLWRDIGEVSLRTEFDWQAIRAIYEEIVARQPSMSKNKLIEELQLEFSERLNKDPPGRSSIQRRLKTWS